MPWVEFCVVSRHVREECGFSRTRQDATHLPGRNFLHWPELRRDPVKLRGFFKREGGDTGVLDAVGTHRNAVVLEDDGAILTHGIARHFSALLSVDLAVEIEDRDLRREDCAAVADGKNI